MTDVTLQGIIAWLKGWFYDKDEITSKEQALQTQINNKASTSDLNTTNSNVSSLQSAMDNKVDKISGKGLSTNDYTTAEKNKLSGIEAQANKTVVDSSLSDSSTNPVQNKVIKGYLDDLDEYDETLYNAIQDLTDTDIASSYTNEIYNQYGVTVTNLGEFTNFVLTRLSNLSGLKAYEVVSTLPTASASTMSKLYIVSENSKVNVYYTTQSGSNYTWHKMDTDILDELRIDWSDIQNKPSTFDPSTHLHNTTQVRYSGETIGNIGMFTSSNTQSQINTAINTKIGQLNSSIAELDYHTAHVYYVDTLPDYGDNEFDEYGLYFVEAENGGYDIYEWDSSLSDGSLGSYGDWVKKGHYGNCITGIELIPKSDDNSGAIRLYYGDES